MIRFRCFVRSFLLVLALLPLGVVQGWAQEPAAGAQKAPAQISLLGAASNEHPDWPGRARSGLGLGVMLMVAFAMSKNRKAINWRLVATGVAIQISLGLVTLSPPGQWVFGGFTEVVNSLLGYTAAGSSFVFGDLALQNSMAVGTSVIPEPAAGDVAAHAQWLGGAEMAPLATPVAAAGWRFVRVGAYFAFGVLPTIIFLSALMAVLYHLGVMQLIVRLLATVMQKTLRTSGAETLSAPGNIFVGQTEAPLLVRPFLKDMTESELMAVMTGGFATVAGGVMIA